MKFKYDIRNHAFAKIKSSEHWTKDIWLLIFPLLKWINTPTQHGSYVHSSSVSAVTVTDEKSQCALAAKRYLPAAKVSFPLSPRPVLYTVNDALWDEIRCRQTGAGEKRLQHAGRLRLSQWQGAACSRGAGLRESSTAESQPTYMLIV